MLNNLALLRAACEQPELRDVREAVELAERACQLSQRWDPNSLGTLAGAYAQAGRFSEAVKTIQEAQAVRGGLPAANSGRDAGKVSRRETFSVAPVADVARLFGLSRCLGLGQIFFSIDLARQPSRLQRMSKNSNQTCSASPAARKQVHLNLKPIAGLLILALTMALCSARADDPDEEYLQIYGLIQEADALATSGKAAPARAKYVEAHTALRNFQKSHLEWKAKLIAFRLNYVAQKVADLSEKPAADAGAGTVGNAPEAQPGAQAAASTLTAQVKLLEAGAEPRKVLRLHPNPGDKQTLSLTMKMAMEMKMGGVQSPATKLPAMTMTTDVTVKAVSDNGDITYELVMGDTSVADEPGASPQVVEAMKSALAGGKGMSATGTISSRGFSKGTEFKAPPGANPQARQVMDQMRDSFSQMAVPLPEEAVGSGAKWEVSMPVKSQGMTIDQTATCELVSIEGEHLTIKRTITQRAANQKIENPAMPGMKVDLTQMTGKGTSERTLDLGKLLPSAGTSDLHSEAAMALDMGGQKQAISTKTDLNVRLEAK